MRENRKDPLVAAVLALAVPGVGHLYCGRPVAAAGFFVVETGLLLVGWRVLLIPIHLYQVGAAGGAARDQTERTRAAFPRSRPAGA